MNLRNRQSVTDRFSRNATTYDACAKVQSFASKRLIQFLTEQACHPAFGPILEVGCGTGLLSEQILRLFPTQEISFLDIAETMIDYARAKLEKNFDLRSASRNFLIADAETFFDSVDTKQCPAKYSLVLSSFTFQWFKDLESTLSKLIKCLDNGGHLFFSTPAAGSFIEWRAMSEALNLPCTANPLPSSDTFLSVAQRLGCTLKMEECQFEDQYDDSLNFFLSLKQLGASTSLVSATQPLSVAQLRQLIRFWNAQTQNRIKITYRILQGCFSI